MSVSIGKPVRHGRTESRRNEKLLREEPRPEILTRLRVGNARLRQCLSIDVFAEVPVGSAECREHTDFAIHQIVARPDTVFLRICTNCEAIDQGIERAFQAILREKPFHRQRRIFLPDAIEAIVRCLHQIGRADLLAAHHGHPIPACDAPEGAGARNVRAGKGERDEPEENECEGEADLGLEDIAKKSEHVCGRSRIDVVRWLPQRTDAFGGSLYPPCDLAATGCKGF